MRFVDRLLQGFRSFILGKEILSTEESRASPRILCYYQVNLRNAGREFEAAISDIGITGMRIEGVPSLQRGERFEISYPFSEGFKEEHSFEVEVMWCRNQAHDDLTVAGVRYVKQGEDLQGTWVYLLLTEVGLLGDAVYQRREHVRLATSYKVLLQEPKTGHLVLDGTVNNLSVGGALVESGAPLAVGRTLLALIGPMPSYPVVTLSARVLNSRVDDDDGRHLISLQFVDFTKEELKALEGLILAMLEGRALE